MSFALRIITKDETMKYKKGQIVKIKPEYQDLGDELIKFVCLENESQGKIEIQAMLGLPINPTQIVTLEMIEPSNQIKP